MADDYHLIFADWDRSIEQQARVITRLLRDSHGLTSGALLDASCGIGAQALGLAKAGFAVTATDISPASVKRCATEAISRGLSVTTFVADLRSLDVEDAGRFDAAIFFDDALPHLLEDDELGEACIELRRVLRPAGALLASIRDYDTILHQRPTGDPPRRFTTESGERIVFQAWDWVSENVYTPRHFIMEKTREGRAVTERQTTYRALKRSTLSHALTTAGFHDIA